MGLSEVGVDVVKVHFADAFAVALGLDLAAECFADIDGILDGGDGDLGHRAVGGFQKDGAETGEAHPPQAFDEDVLDPVEFDLIDVLVDDSVGDSEAFGGDFEGMAADDEEPPACVEEGDGDGKPEGLEEDAANDDRRGDDDSGEVMADIEPLGRAALPIGGLGSQGWCCRAHGEMVGCAVELGKMSF